MWRPFPQVDPLLVLLQAAFYVVFAVSVWRWATRRGPLEPAVVSVFRPIALLFLTSLVNVVDPQLVPIFWPFLIAAFYLQPWFVLRLVDLIRPGARRVSWLRLAGGVVSAALTIVFGSASVAALLAGVFFFAVQGAAAA